MNCSIARTLEVIGEWWTLLILRDAFLGLRRFDDFQRSLGIARNILTDRLNTLVGHGILERICYQERPARYEYGLTEKGRDLYPVIIGLLRWGDHWTAGPEGPPLVLEHQSCGQEVMPILVCPTCREEITAQTLHPHPGPGAKAQPATESS
jgi:DNA-binding HxlR family transcriptional regulator